MILETGARRTSSAFGGDSSPGVEGGLERMKRLRRNEAMVDYLSLQRENR